MTGLRSLVYNLCFYVTLVVLMIVGLPSILMGRHAVFFMGRLWGVCSLWLLEQICGLRVEFRGLGNIPKGGYIIASKHQSFLETFSLIQNAPDFAYVLKHELMYIPMFGWYLWGAEQIGIDRARGKSAIQVLSERAAAVLRAGRQIFIFPEGTRRPPGAPPQYKYGVAYLYETTGVPCLPVALNTGLYWGRRGFRRLPGVAIIEYLPPIPPGLERDAFLAKLEATIETASARLNAEAVAQDSSLAPRLAPAQS
jgi:1-acyl-sn-glycerol-3-phosphate acyltransferase